MADRRRIFDYGHQEQPREVTSRGRRRSKPPRGAYYDERRETEEAGTSEQAQFEDIGDQSVDKRDWPSTSDEPPFRNYEVDNQREVEDYNSWQPETDNSRERDRIAAFSNWNDPRLKGRNSVPAPVEFTERDSWRDEDRRSRTSNSSDYYQRHDSRDRERVSYRDRNNSRERHPQQSDRNNSRERYPEQSDRNNSRERYPPQSDRNNSRERYPEQSDRNSSRERYPEQSDRNNSRERYPEQSDRNNSRERYPQQSDYHGRYSRSNTEYHRGKSRAAWNKQKRGYNNYRQQQSRHYVDRRSNSRFARSNNRGNKRSSSSTYRNENSNSFSESSTVKGVDLKESANTESTETTNDSTEVTTPLEINNSLETRCVPEEIETESVVPSSSLSLSPVLPVPPLEETTIETSSSSVLAMEVIEVDPTSSSDISKKSEVSGNSLKKKKSSKLISRKSKRKLSKELFGSPPRTQMKSKNCSSVTQEDSDSSDDSSHHGVSPTPTKDSQSSSVSNENETETTASSSTNTEGQGSVTDTNDTPRAASPPRFVLNWEILSDANKSVGPKRERVASLLRQGFDIWKESVKIKKEAVDAVSVDNDQIIDNNEGTESPAVPDQEEHQTLLNSDGSRMDAEDETNNVENGTTTVGLKRKASETKTSQPQKKNKRRKSQKLTRTSVSKPVEDEMMRSTDEPNDNSEETDRNRRLSSETVCRAVLDALEVEEDVFDPMTTLIQEHTNCENQVSTEPHVISADTEIQINTMMTEKDEVRSENDVQVTVVAENISSLSPISAASSQEFQEVVDDSTKDKTVTNEMTSSEVAATSPKSNDAGSLSPISSTDISVTEKSTEQGDVMAPTPTSVHSVPVIIAADPVELSIISQSVAEVNVDSSGTTALQQHASSVNTDDDDRLVQPDLISEQQATTNVEESTGMSLLVQNINEDVATAQVLNPATHPVPSSMAEADTPSNNNNKTSSAEDENSVSVIVSGSRLDATALAGRDDLVTVDIESFLSPRSENQVESEKETPLDMPQLMLTELDFPVLSIPEREAETTKDSKNSNKNTCEKETENMEPNITSEQAEDETGAKSPVIIPAIGESVEKSVGEEEEMELDDDNDHSTCFNPKIVNVSGEQAPPVNEQGQSTETNESNKDTEESTEEPIRIRTDLFVDDVDDQTKELLKDIRMKATNIGKAVCSYGIKLEHAFENCSAAEQLTAFRQLLNIISKSYQIMNRLDLHILAVEALKFDLPQTVNYDQYKNITIEEMSDYFLALLQLTMMLKVPEFEEYKTNVCILHLRVARILKYYMIAKVPSQAEGNFMNILRAATTKNSNILSHCVEINGVWDYLRRLEIPMDEYIVLQEHATVGIKGFKSLITSISVRCKGLVKQPTAAAGQSTSTSTSTSQLLAQPAMTTPQQPQGQNSGNVPPVVSQQLVQTATTSQQVDLYNDVDNEVEIVAEIPTGNMNFGAQELQQLQLQELQQQQHQYVAQINPTPQQQMTYQCQNQGCSMPQCNPAQRVIQQSACSSGSPSQHVRVPSLNQSLQAHPSAQRQQYQPYQNNSQTGNQTGVSNTPMLLTQLNSRSNSSAPRQQQNAQQVMTPNMALQQQQSRQYQVSQGAVPIQTISNQGTPYPPHVRQPPAGYQMSSQTASAAYGGQSVQMQVVGGRGSQQYNQSLNHQSRNRIAQQGTEQRVYNNSNQYVLPTTTVESGNRTSVNSTMNYSPYVGSTNVAVVPTPDGGNGIQIRRVPVPVNSGTTQQAGRNSTQLITLGPNQYYELNGALFGQNQQLQQNTGSGEAHQGQRNNQEAVRLPVRVRRVSVNPLTQPYQVGQPQHPHAAASRSPHAFQGQAQHINVQGGQNTAVQSGQNTLVLAGQNQNTRLHAGRNNIVHLGQSNNITGQNISQQYVHEVQSVENPTAGISSNNSQNSGDSTTTSNPNVTILHYPVPD